MLALEKQRQAISDFKVSQSYIGKPYLKNYFSFSPMNPAFSEDACYMCFPSMVSVIRYKRQERNLSGIQSGVASDHITFQGHRHILTLA